MLTIYDAVAWQTMPKGEPILVYMDGDYVTYPDALALRPSLFFTVTTTGKTVADICDVESGNASPALAAFGVRMGFWHTVYCSLSMFPAVANAMAAQGSPQWAWFAADPTGEPHLPAGASACQYAWHSLGQCPANYDVSTALPSWAQKATSPQLLPKGTRLMGVTQLSNGEIAIDAVGAGESAGHQLLFVVNLTNETSRVIDATAGVGAKGPGGSLFTVAS